MVWYDEAVFYHIYPLGLSGAPEHNDYKLTKHRLMDLFPWIKHIKEIGCNGLYIGPLFESVGHGYETTDYKKLDSRLGYNEDLKTFVAECHKEGIKVIFDGVFNHCGRDFFAFKDLKENRENSRYKDWFCNVNFCGNNEYNDGFSYDNWGGYNLLVKLNQRNPEVVNYLTDVIRFWVGEFDVDGIRLDAADVLDFGFMEKLRQVADEVKEDFWLMGEVIHGDYSRWVNHSTLNSVTDYMLHKGLYSSCNDHNFFEIAHTIKHLKEVCGNEQNLKKLYNFVDNHDVERIWSKLNNKAHYTLVNIMMYALPGIPSIYYGSEFGIEGKKTYGTDAPLRPKLDLDDYKDAIDTNFCTKLIVKLGKIYKENLELTYGSYNELHLTTTEYVFERRINDRRVIVALNSNDYDKSITVDLGEEREYSGAIFGSKVECKDGKLTFTLNANSGEIFVPDIKHSEVIDIKEFISEQEKQEEAKENSSFVDFENHEVNLNKPYEEMNIEELQFVIYNKMKNNGPVTDQMRRDIEQNVYKDSLLNWARSF